METVKQEKVRGKCTGCAFEYQLSTARSGEYKGSEVVRKHNSRVGPGLCEGAQKPPAVESGETTGGAQASTGPEPVKGDRPHLFTAGYGSDGSCGHRITAGDEIRADGEGGFLCGQCSESEPGCCDECRSVDGDVSNAVELGQELGRHLAQSTPEAVSEFADPAPVPETGAAPASVTEFADPAPMPAEMQSVNGQPEEDRDRYGRYLLNGVPHTRTTTFVKMGSSTYALGEWNERMLLKGLVERPDLLAMAHGMDVKRDRVRMNALIDDAQKHAGNKVAANIGSAYHAFTERLDAGVMTLEDVPPQWRGRCAEYVAKLAEYDLTTRREWIERTTAVRADQVSAPLPVAGKLDRILQLPNGDLVIGDLKTSSNIEYGWSEIAAQLAVYAHGVNTHGLYDWNTKSWGPVAWDRAYHPDTPAVRTDYAIVMHLPADGEGCHLYRVDLVKGWAFAQVSGRVQARQKDKSVAAALTVLDVQAPPVAVGASDLLPDTPVMSASVKAADLDVMTKAAEVIGTAQTRAELAPVYEYAATSGRFTAYQLGVVKRWCAERWEQLPA